MVVATVDEKMTAIADAIRERTGKTDVLSLDDMADNIPRVYEEGKKSQYDEFWDNFQDYGNRTAYTKSFMHNWNDVNFKPKYDLNIRGSLSQAFMYSQITDLTVALEKAGVIFDTTNVTNFSEMMSYSTITRLPEIVTYGATSFASAFSGTHLITIDKLVLKEDGSQSFANSFQNCSRLANIVIEGKIGQNISFSNSPNITYDSLMGDNGIINALYDYSDTTTTRTLTLHATARRRLSESDIAIATQKGWTIA